MTAADDNWTESDAYEMYMGRWSRLLARIFVIWLGAPRGLTLDGVMQAPGGPNEDREGGFRHGGAEPRRQLDHQYRRLNGGAHDATPNER